MNIDRVFVCDIYKLIKVENYFYNDHDVTNKDFSLDRFLRVKRRVDFIKEALVYYDKSRNYYIDLETKEKYRFGVFGCPEGDMFIDTRKEVIYGSKLINSNRKHVSRKKMLKRYIEYKKGDTSECK